MHSTRPTSFERDLKRNGVMAKREKGYMMEAVAAAETLEDGVYRWS